MTETTRRLTYAVPLALIAALLLLENAMPQPYVFSDKTGPISHLYFKVFKPESLRYSKALIKVSEAYREAAAGRSAQAGEELKAASLLLTEVNKAWTFERLPADLGGDNYDVLRKDLPALAAELSKGAVSPGLPENARTAGYLERARKELGNGGIL